MKEFLAVVCWVSIGLIVYSYVIYPFLLLAVCRFRKNRIDSADRQPETRSQWPLVSLVIAAYREQDVIEQRVRNALSMDYPADRLEILIGVDGQEDATGELVAAFSDPRVKLLQYPQRRGKASVLNDSIPQANGEIILLSDANTFWDRDAVKKLIAPFEDPQVGGVVGQLILTDAETGKNIDGVYWRYENCLKEWEGQIGALLGANGAIYAIRQELFSPIPANTIVDDFLIGMRIHQAGRHLLYEKQAIAREETAPTIQDEFKRRTRIGAGNFQSLGWLSRMLLPDYGVVSWAFWSHKVLRWICPFLMILALVSNYLLAEIPLFRVLLMGQSLFYALALLGGLPRLSGKWVAPGRMAWMFVNMNIALGCGFYRWLFRTQKGTWKRTERSATEGLVRC